MRLWYSARSHLGLARDKNEDKLFADSVFQDSSNRSNQFCIDGYSEESVILAICDGMGGEDNGDIASQIAVEMLKESESEIKLSSIKNQENAVQSYIDKVDNELHSMCRDTNLRMGTTLAMAIISNKGIRCFSLGDSRIYMFCKSGLTKITNDHTLTADKIKCGIITKEEEANDIDRHKLTKCIGIGYDHDAEKYKMYRRKCRLLICSDGLTDMVSESRIATLLKYYSDTSEAANELLKEALKNGGRDNISIILADISFLNATIYKIVNKLGGKNSI